MKTGIKEKAKKFPESPGVYLFKDGNGRVIYVGRASSLKKRIASYFSARADARTKELVAEATGLSFRKTATLLDAVVLEANLIKKYWPKFNVRERDDRSFVYLVIPRSEKFPRPLIARGRETEKFRPFKAEIIGPFQSYRLLKTALSLARRIFPFSDCSGSAPAAAGREKRPCFYYQIGLCPGVCAGKADEREYKKNIRNLILFFRGEKRRLLQKLKKENPEKIKALIHVQDVSLLGASEGRRPFSGGRKLFRVEGYDISHFFGKNPVGAMVVFTDGEKDPSQYRLFNIRAGEGRNFDDLAMLEETLERRLNHPEWPLPDVIFVDGGLNQVKIAKKVLAKNRLSIPAVGLAKSAGRSAAKAAGDKLIIANAKKSARELLRTSRALFQEMRDEAHRFAIRAGRRKSGTLRP